MNSHEMPEWESVLHRGQPRVVRLPVPGGWLYRPGDGEDVTPMVFVPAPTEPAPVETPERSPFDGLEFDLQVVRIVADLMPNLDTGRPRPVFDFLRSLISAQTEKGFVRAIVADDRGKPQPRWVPTPRLIRALRDCGATEEQVQQVLAPFGGPLLK